MKKSLLLSLSGFLLSQYVNAVDVDNLDGKNFATFKNQKGFEFPLSLDFSTENNPEKLIININNIPFEIVNNTIKINNKGKIIVPDDFKIEKKDNYLEIFTKDTGNSKKRKRNNNEDSQFEKRQKIYNKDLISDNIIDLSVKKITETELSPAYMQAYFLGLKHAADLKDKFDFLDKALNETSDPVMLHIAEAELAYMYYYGRGPAENDPNRLQKAFDLLMNVVSKSYDPKSQQVAQTLLAHMYLNGRGPAADDTDRFKKAFYLYDEASRKTYDLEFQHSAEVNLAHMYLKGLGPALEDPDRFKKAFELFKIAASKTNNKNSEDFAKINLAEMYLYKVGPAVEDPNRLKKVHDLCVTIKQKRILTSEGAMADAYLAEMSLFDIVPELDKENRFNRLNEVYDFLKFDSMFYFMNQRQKSISGHLCLTLFGIMHLDSNRTSVNESDRFQKAFDYLDFASKQEDNLRAQHLAEVRLAEMYLNNLGPAANDPDRMKKAFDLLDNASKKTDHPRALHRAQTLLAKMYFLDSVPAPEAVDEYKKAFDLFKIAVDKEDDLAAQHIALTYLAEMYYGDVHFDLNCDDGYEKASTLYEIASKKTNDPVAQHKAQTKLAVIKLDTDYFDDDEESISLRKSNLEEGFDLLIIAVDKTDDLESQHIAQTRLGSLYLNRFYEQKDPNDLEISYDLLIIAANKTDDFHSKELAQKELFDLLTLIINENIDPKMVHMAHAQLGLMYLNRQVFDVSNQDRLQKAFDLLKIAAYPNDSADPVAEHIAETRLAEMFLYGWGPAANDPDRLQKAFVSLEIAANKTNDLASQHLAEARLAEMYIYGWAQAANIPARLERALNLLNEAVNKTHNLKAQHIAQTLLAMMNVYGWGPAANDQNRFEKAFNLLNEAVNKTHDLKSQHIGQVVLANMYFYNQGPAANDPNRLQKAFDLLEIAAKKEDCPKTQHMAQTRLANMYFNAQGPAANDPDRLKKAFDLFNIAVNKTDDDKSQHYAQTRLAYMYLHNLGRAKNDPYRLQEAFKLFNKAANKTYDLVSQHMAQIALASMYFKGQIPLLNEFDRLEKVCNFFVAAVANPGMLSLNCEQSIQNLLLEIYKSSDYKLTLEIIFKRQIAKEPANMDLKLIAYLIFGVSFQEEYNQFMVQHWAAMDNNQKLALCQRLINRLDSENTRLQEVLILLAREGGNHSDAVSIYADLFVKLKNSYTHNPSIFALKVEGENEEILHFAINPDIFDYLPASQVALADLDDVDFILGVDVDPKLKEIRNNQDFKKYFEAPFSEESMMIQAMVKKFKKMGENGQKKLAFLMHDMAQCSQGKNQAIWDHYSIESKPLCFADLKNITDWLMRLQQSDIDLSSIGKSKNQLIVLIGNMLKKEHIFRQHLTDLKTEEAQLLKALLGSVVEIEKNDRIDLKETLKLALNILVKLSNSEDFYKNLNELCEAHEIYLPANKFGDQLSSVAIEDLIQKLKPSDVEGLGEFSLLQEEMGIFANSEDFQSLLHNFDIEEGDKFRELIRGYVSNGWSVGLLKLMALAKENTLKDAVVEIYKHTSIDKDMSLSWMGLKKLLIKELIDLKRQSINAIAEELMGRTYNGIPHEIGYIEGLIGGVIGLRHVHKAPNFDFSMKQSTVTAKSLQEILDLFHQNFTADKIVNHVKEMLDQHKLSIIHPETGVNIIWEMVGIAAKDQLLAKGIDTKNIDDLLYDDAGVKELALPLLLVKLGILQEVGEDGHLVVNNNMIID
ncbi:MAG: hypothetical protein Q8S31_06310 [Alphaproteobacteria bacterium]|nr:hypothetical protein [Alphaproteobacteria bacterium]